MYKKTFISTRQILFSSSRNQMQAAKEREKVTASVEETTHQTYLVRREIDKKVRENERKEEDTPRRPDNPNGYDEGEENRY